MVSKQKKQKKTISIIQKTYKKGEKTRLAQLVERTPFKRVVVGSSPTSGEGTGGRHERSPKSGNGGTYPEIQVVFHDLKRGVGLKINLTCFKTGLFL